MNFLQYKKTCLDSLTKTDNAVYNMVAEYNIEGKDGQDITSCKRRALPETANCINLTALLTY